MNFRSLVSLLYLQALPARNNVIKKLNGKIGGYAYEYK